MELNIFDLQIDGTLIARGTSTDRIIFQVSVSFPESELTDLVNHIYTIKPQLEQTNTCTIMENAYDSAGIEIINTSPKIDNNLLLIGRDIRWN